jgi:hypothetical protein
MQGPLTITDGLSVNGACILGDNVSDTHIINGEVSVTGVTEIDQDLTLNEDLLIQSTKKIAEELTPNAQYILFEDSKMEFASHRDFIFLLDADDTIDGQSQNASFTVKDGLGNDVLALTEDGNMILTEELSLTDLTASNRLRIGDELDITQNKLDVKSEIMHVQLDKNNVAATARFLVTMDGDTGASLSSADLLLNLDESANLVTGRHILKSGVQEVGYFGMQTYSNNAGGVFFGNGVNFKTEMTNQPASITLTVDENVNADNISVTHLSKYGFFWEFDTPAVGATKVRGTYETIGN